MSNAGQTRLAPVPKEQWSDEMRDALRAGFPAAAERILADGPDAMRPPNVLATLLHNPPIAGSFVAYNRVLLEAPTLGHRLRELMVLRVAWRTRSTYEWVQHVRLAKQVGISADEINAVTDDSGAAKWTPLEADLLAATDQLLDGYRIDDATWKRLAEALDEQQLVELVFVVGTYTALAMAFNSFGLELDPDLEVDPSVPHPLTPTG